MVKKYKFLLIAIFAVLMLLLVPTISQADVEVTRSFPSNDGTIVLNVTGLELSDEKQYEFSIVSKGGTPENWFLVTDFSDTTASITLSAGTSKIANVLATTDNGQLFIREKDNTEEYIVNRKNVSFKLPYIGSVAYTKNEKEYLIYGTAAQIYGKIGSYYEYGNDASNTTYAWEKIQDREFITNFLNIKKNSGNFKTLESYLSNVPNDFSSGGTHPNYKAKNDGLYLLWIKRVGNNCKEIYSVIIHDGLPEATKVNQYIEGADVTAPTVESIQIVSPKSGNYTAGQEVQIRVFFSEKIVATTAPTLKVKVGEGAAQSLTEGVVKNENNKGYITYTYTIKATDKGQIQVTGLTGGNVQDESENDAVLSSPALTGSITITANLTEEEQQPTDGEWSDFSKAKYSLVRSFSQIILSISNVNLKNSSFKLIVKPDNTKPQVSDFDDSDNIVYVTYDGDKKVLYTESNDLFTKYFELNQDVYISILEYNNDSRKSNIAISAKKITKPTQSKYFDSFESTSFATYTGTQIVTNLIHSGDVDRKMTIKIGKITDTEILKKIKNSDASGFADLLALAKSDKGLYNKKVDVTKNVAFMQYLRDKDEDGMINLAGKLKDKEYYYLYVEADNENGKYIDAEAVTLAQASTYSDGAWYMFFYGTDDFKWADFGEAGDNTTADKVLPKTGVDMIAVFTIVVVAAGAIVAGVKYNRFRDIK